MKELYYILWNWLVQGSHQRIGALFDWWIEKNASKSMVEKSKFQPMSDWVKSSKSSPEPAEPPVSGVSSFSTCGRFQGDVSMPDRTPREVLCGIAGLLSCGWWLRLGVRDRCTGVPPGGAKLSPVVANRGAHSYDGLILRSTVCTAEIVLAIGFPARIVDNVCNEA
jgi:hypothetical protein